MSKDNRIFDLEERLRLKAYGNNVEKLFCVKPGAVPEQIKISLSGIQPPESPFSKGDLTKSPLEKLGGKGVVGKR